MPREDVGEIMRKYRLRSKPKMSQKQLGELIGLDQSDVSKIENKKMKLSQIAPIRKLSQITGRTIEQLIS